MQTGLSIRPAVTLLSFRSWRSRRTTLTPYWQPYHTRRRCPLAVAFSASSAVDLKLTRPPPSPETAPVFLDLKSLDLKLLVPGFAAHTTPRLWLAGVDGRSTDSMTKKKKKKKRRNRNRNRKGKGKDKGE